MEAGLALGWPAYGDSPVSEISPCHCINYTNVRVFIVTNGGLACLPTPRFNEERSRHAEDSPYKHTQVGLP